MELPLGRCALVNGAYLKVRPLSFLAVANRAARIRTGEDKER